MKRVYIAGPYTKGDVARNVAEAVRIGNQIASGCVAVFIPHLTHFWHMLFPRAYEFWLRQDMAWLEVCDCLLRLPGESMGADAEASRMLELRRPVFTDIASLMEWCETG